MSAQQIQGIRALARGLEILEWIARRSEPVTLTQIAQGLKLNVPEVQRPVAYLWERGYLNRTAAGGYQLSGLLYRLAQAYPPHLRIQRGALPFMLAFARDSGHSVHLCVPDGEGVLLLADVPGGGLVKISVQQGARLDSNSTVSGRILQAFGLLKNPAKEGEEWNRKLEAIRDRGYELAGSAYAEGIIDLGVPVIDSRGEAVGALTSSILELKGQDRHLEETRVLLQECAGNIGRAI
jgi:DNA-binding IclR family transcriptional regulator